MSDKVEELKDRYKSACHAMQSGVAMMMHHGDAHTPKHLRVGVNSSLINSSALGHLLIKKGIITEEEYWQEIVNMLEAEVKDYQEKLSKIMGANIKLG